jgi:hypothetical protein
MKGILSKVVTIAFVIAFLFFGMKGCVVTTWKPPAEPTTFSVRGADGRSLSMIFLPDSTTLIVYTEEKTGSFEAALTEMRGTFGTHYFWRLWNVDGPDSIAGLPGYRIYPPGAQPVVMETTVIKKFVHGTAKPALRTEGDRTHPVILFSENAVRFEDMWLQKEPTDIDGLDALKRQINPPK